MSTVRPQDLVTLQLSDQDFRDLVAESFDNNLIYTGGYGQSVTIRVDDITRVISDDGIEAEAWRIVFGIDVEKKETS